MKKILTRIVLSFVISAVFSLAVCAQTPWTVPANYKTLRNPLAGETNSEQGKKLFNAHCMSCHGNMGNGNGLKAPSLLTPIKNLSAPEVQNQTDGELYYKTIIGRNEMPNFERRIPNEDERWLIINYIRTLKN